MNCGALRSKWLLYTKFKDTSTSQGQSTNEWLVLMAVWLVLANRLWGRVIVKSYLDCATFHSFSSYYIRWKSELFQMVQLQECGDPYQPVLLNHHTNIIYPGELFWPGTEKLAEILWLSVIEKDIGCFDWYSFMENLSLYATNLPPLLNHHHIIIHSKCYYIKLSFICLLFIVYISFLE